MGKALKGPKTANIIKCPKYLRIKMFELKQFDFDHEIHTVALIKHITFLH